MAQQGSYIPPSPLNGSNLLSHDPNSVGPSPHHAPHLSQHHHKPFQHQYNQQYYPNSYPAVTFPDAQAHSRPAPTQQHVPSPQYPHLARAPSVSMPPPSTIPGDINKGRHIQPQRPPNLWPRELSEEQRQIQEQYTQNAQASLINPYYAQQPTPTTAASTAPTPSITLPPRSQSVQHQQLLAQNPASTSQPAPSMTAATLPASPAPSAPAVQQPPTTSTPNPEAHSTQPSKPVSTQNPSALSTDNPAQSQPQQQQQPAIQTPSPFEAARVTALLDINRRLLQELSHVSASPSSDPSKEAETAKPQSSPHYVDYMRRLQANLAYLASVADRPHKPWNSVPLWPAIMAPPEKPKGPAGEEAGETPGEKELRESYENLGELWPDWKEKMKAEGGGKGE